MYEIISLLISLGSAAGSGAQDTALSRIKADGATSRQFIEEGKAFALAGWEPIGRVADINNVLAKKVSEIAVTKSNVALKKAEEKAKFNRMVAYAIAGSAALMIIFIVMKK